MSSFICEHCKAEIIEGKNGRYITECEHYPLDAETGVVVTGIDLSRENDFSCEVIAEYRLGVFEIKEIKQWQNEAETQAQIRIRSEG